MPSLTEVLHLIETGKQVVQLSAVVAGEVKPLFQAAVLAWKELRRREDGTVEYVAVLEAGQAQLSQAEQNAQEAITAIDAELARLKAAEPELPLEPPPVQP